MSYVSEEGIQAAKRVVNENWKALGRITFWEIVSIKLMLIMYTGIIMAIEFSRRPWYQSGRDPAVAYVTFDVYSLMTLRVYSLNRKTVTSN